MSVMIRLFDSSELSNDRKKPEFLKVILPDNDMKVKTNAILKSYRDQDISYTDAVSFVILESMNINDVFSFDSHFYIIKRILWPIVKNA